ncbi:hypothetical protein [Thalassococcus sp. BH17M4-6]
MKTLLLAALINVENEMADAARNWGQTTDILAGDAQCRCPR